MNVKECLVCLVCVQMCLPALLSFTKSSPLWEVEVIRGVTIVLVFLLHLVPQAHQQLDYQCLRIRGEMLPWAWLPHEASWTQCGTVENRTNASGAGPHWIRQGLLLPRMTTTPITSSRNAVPTKVMGVQWAKVTTSCHNHPRDKDQTTRDSPYTQSALITQTSQS